MESAVHIPDTECREREHEYTENNEDGIYSSCYNRRIFQRADCFFDHYLQAGYSLKYL